jgi:hypothetical protein
VCPSNCRSGALPAYKVAKKQRHECEKVSGPREAMGELLHDIECIPVKHSETEEAVERAALGGAHED